MSDKTVLEFSKKYDADHALNYLHKHERGLKRRASNWIEQRMLAKALVLAGDPASVLDLPCGAGRFWKLLASRPDRRLLAADYSQHMVDTAARYQPPEIASRFECFQTSAFDIGRPDNAVEAIVCMRLLHHIGTPEDRRKIFDEFRRVASRSVVVSFWVDGNLQAGRRKRAEARRRKRDHPNRFLFEVAGIEAEMRAAGFEIVGHVDMLPGISMWRTYVLRKAA